MAYEALKVIRPFVKVGSYFAPKLTGNLVFKLFCFPPKAGKLNDTQKKLILRAEARLADAERLRVPFNKGWVKTYRFPTTQAISRGTVLLLHGWTSRAAFMTAFIEPLQFAGFDVLAIDLPGHGLSSGRELNVALGVAALHAVQSKFGAWYGIIAHSFGGAVATSFISGAIKPYPAVSVNRLALIATPNSIPDLFQWFGNAVGLTRKGQRSFNANVFKLSGNTLDFFIGENLLRQAGIKTLVLHAPDDKELTYSNAEGLAAAGSHVTLQPMPGLGHRRILYAPSTVSAVLPFLKED